MAVKTSCHRTSSIKISITVFVLRESTHRFRQYVQGEKEIKTLQKMTEFVERYLNKSSVWSFDDKDQSLLTSEVGSCDCHMHWQEAHNQHMTCIFLLMVH